MKSYALKIGETLSLALSEIRDESGAAVASLDGWSAVCHVRTAPAAAVASLTLTGAATGATFFFSGSTASLAAGTYYADVKLTSPTGFVSFPAEFTVAVSPPITRP